MPKSIGFYLLAGVGAFGLLLGGLLGARFDDKAMSLIRSFSVSSLGPTEEAPYPPAIKTTFLTFDIDTIPVPRSRRGSGGGLTRFGDSIALMTHDGRVFGLTADRDLRPLEITLPDNGVAAYERVTQAPEYADQVHLVPRFRYNGFNFVDAPAFRGFLMSTTHFDEDRVCYTNRLYSAEVAENVRDLDGLTLGVDDWQLLYETAPCLEFLPDERSLVGEMASGRMTFVAPNTVYMTNGDYYLNETNVAPNLPADMSYGKIAAIDIRDGSTRYATSGHRNPSGITVDADGNIWSVEHGAFGGDELNLIEDGNDYGWPEWSFGQRYTNDLLRAPPLADPGFHTGATAPVYAWLPSEAVSSITTIDGFDPTWDGDLLIGTLGRSPNVGRKLLRVRVQDQAVVFAEAIHLGERVRDVLQWNDQTLVLWMDRSELVLMTKRDDTEDANKRIAAALDTLPEATRAAVGNALASCRECHAVVPDLAGAAPTLYGVVNRTIAGTAYPDYSDALRATEGEWSVERLQAFIEDPDSVVPDTNMMATGLVNEAVIGDLIRVLDALDDTPDS